MFFYVINNSPFWEKIPLEKKAVRAFIMGMICYILLHTFLFSKFAETKENLVFFRNYIYYMFAGDLFMSNVMTKIHMNNRDNNDNLHNYPALLGEQHHHSNPNIPTFEEFLKMQQKSPNMVNNLNLNSFTENRNQIEPIPTFIENRNHQIELASTPTAQPIIEEEEVVDKSSLHFPIYVNKKETYENEIKKNDIDIDSIQIPSYKSKKIYDINIPVYSSKSS